jgi:hypothetical protein
MKLELIDMTKLYKQGDNIVLKEPCKTKLNKYKKGERFVVEAVNETTLYLISEHGGLTIHRFLNHLIEKVI